MIQRYPSALELARAFAAGTADPRAVAQEALARAARAPGVFLAITSERALAEADASSARWRAKQPLSALDGVPIAWKDLFDIADTVTSAGSRVFARSAPATRDAQLVAAATAAGLVCIGKTGLTELAYSGLGLNPHFGTPVNPAIDGGRRVPGGSSSGSAIAVATGIVPIAVGTDTAGSIRIPSAFNGLIGYRASVARYSRAGTFALSRSLDTLGPIAATIADCVAWDDVIGARASGIPPHDELHAGPHDPWNHAPHQELHQELHHEPGEERALGDTRFIVDPTLDARYDVSPGVAANLEHFATRLESCGAIVERRPMPSLARVHALIRERGWLGGLEAFAHHRGLLDSADAHLLDPRVRTRLEASRDIPEDRLAELIEQRHTLIAAFRQELGDATLVMPTVRQTAPALAPLDSDPEWFARTNLAVLSMTMPGSFLDTPAFALPSGNEHGAPTSVQLMRAQGDDKALLDIMRAIDRARIVPISD